MQVFRPAGNCSLLTGICLMICWSESQQQGQASEGAGSAELCLIWPCLDLPEQPPTSHQEGSKDLLEVPGFKDPPKSPLLYFRVLTIAHSCMSPQCPPSSQGWSLRMSEASRSALACLQRVRRSFCSCLRWRQCQSGSCGYEWDWSCSRCHVLPVAGSRASFSALKVGLGRRPQHSNTQIPGSC